MKKQFKSKLLSILLVLVMVLAIIPVSTFTALAAEGTDGEVIVTVTKSALSVGETTELFFRINAKTDPLGSANIYITIPEGLEYVSHEILVSTTDYMFSAYNVTSGLFGFAVTSTGKTGTFDALKLTLRAKDVNIGANAVGLRVGNMSKLDGATMMNYGSLEAITITTSIPITHAHVYDNEFNGADATSHWKECIGPNCPDKTDSIKNIAAHTDANADSKCDICSYTIPKTEENDTTASTPDISDTNTDKPTDETDKTSDATDNPTDATESEKDDSTETEAPADKIFNGCGSTLALSTLAIVGLIGSAIVIKKKED